MAVLLITVSSGAAPIPSLLERLGVPSLDKPWRLRGLIAGIQVDLKLPQESEIINELPIQVQAEVRQRILYRNSNLPKLHQVTTKFDDLLDNLTFQQIPEYKRSLSEVVIALHPSDRQLPDPLYRHLPLLKMLPSYSWIHLYIPKELEARTNASLNKAGLETRSSLEAVDIWQKQEAAIPLKHATTRWAQDLFEVATDNQGKSYVLTPITHYQINDLSRSDNDYLSTLQSKQRSVIKLPIFFRGGNVLLGEADKRVLLVGQREVNNNRNDFYTAVFSPPKTIGVMEIWKRIAGADEVHLIPNSKHLFHLDMAMSFLDEHKVALLDPIDHENLIPEDKHVLVTLRKVLIKNGFEVVPIPTMTQRIEDFQSVTNIIPFTDKNTGNKKALIPLFPDIEVIQHGSPQSLNVLIESAYQQGGVEPIIVEDRFHNRSGNLHCALNVLN